MYDAINRGLARTTGEICAWLNSDEQYLPGTLGKVLELFSKDPTTDVLLGDALLVDSDVKPICYRRIMVPSRWHTRLDHLHSLSCAMFFKRAALPSPPLDPRWKVISDAVLMDYFQSAAKKVYSCKDLLSVYAFTGKNLSSRPSGELQAWWKETEYPPRALKMLVVILHRLRRFLGGAYRTRLVVNSVFIMNHPNPRSFSARVPGTWPIHLCK